MIREKERGASIHYMAQRVTALREGQWSGHDKGMDWPDLHYLSSFP